MFLAHKISRAKWEPRKELSEEEISADAVTADLRTQDNNLSFWKCEPDSKKSVEDVVLAIAASGERIDKIDLVWLTDNELLNDGHILKNTDGKTPVADLVNKHFDVCRLDYVRLGKIAHRVAAAIKANQHCRLTGARVTKLLVTAVKQERINLDRLKEEVRAKVQNLLDPNPS